MKLVEAIAKKLKSMKSIKIAILYGSQATGKARKDSDIDICVIGIDSEAEMKALEYGSDKVDISPFSRLPTYIQYRVFRDGRVLFNKDDKLLTRKKFWAITWYLDEKHWRDRLTQKVLS